MILLALSFTACSDDDGGTNPEDNAKPWVGVWLSADANVAPILVSLFNYDSVRVTMNADQTVTLESHIKDGAWSTTPGVYTVTEAASGDVHYVNINYTSFEQEGIIQVTTGNPDTMKLEAVQTVPDIGAVNIQNYVRVN